MDKSLMIYIAIGIGFLYFITSFVGDIQAEDEAYRNNDYNKQRQYDKYKTVDSIGQEILDLTGADANIQFEVWNNSILKEDFLELFPKFFEMKNFINDRIRGKILQDKLLEIVKDIENKFFSGSISAEQAKHELSNLK